TRVTLGHVHVPEVGEAGGPRFLLTTELSFRLSPSHFDRWLAAKINQANREKGRVVFAVDLALNEVVAAIAYHIPEDGSSPLLITALAPRIDVAAPVGRACVPMLKACLHQLGAYLGRGGQLGLRPGGAPIDEAKQLYGFRPAPSLGPNGGPLALPIGVDGEGAASQFEELGDIRRGRGVTRQVGIDLGL